MHRCRLLVSVPTLIDPIVMAPELLSHPDLSDSTQALPRITHEDLPHCPSCNAGLLRPSVVWFGESLLEDVLSRIDVWFEKAGEVDLILVIGTAAYVTPALEYISRARARGARIAFFNLYQHEQQVQQLRKEDWFFLRDATFMLPELPSETLEAK